MKQYLLLFYHFDHRGYGDFRLEELQSLCELYGNFNPLLIDIQTAKSMIFNNPCLMIQLPNEETAIKICARSMLIKAIYDVIADSNSDFSSIIHSIEQNIENIKRDLQENHCLHKTHRIRCVFFGKKGSFAEQMSIVRQLEIPFLSHLTGDISLTDAEVEYHAIYNYGDFAHHGNSQPLKHPLHIYFTRLIAECDRHLIRDFSLKGRKYVGSTSLDSELAFLMANQAKVMPGSLIFDPFCGTGSALLAASQFGAISMGADIDMRVLRGNKYFEHGIKKNDNRRQHKSQYTEEKEIVSNTKHHSIYANFEQYNLPKPELIRCDLSSVCWLLMKDMKWDAIICDPPYGLRAGAKKSGHQNPITIPLEFVDSHHPRTQAYDTCEVMLDLLNFAAKCLRMQGRFVYLLPATNAFVDKDLPLHPCLQLISNSEQVCQGIFRRRLITMVKYREWDEQKSDELRAQTYIPSKPDFAHMKEKIYWKIDMSGDKNIDNENLHLNKNRKRKTTTESTRAPIKKMRNK